MSAKTRYKENFKYSPCFLFLHTPFVCKTDVLKPVSLINYLHLASSKNLQFSMRVFYPHSNSVVFKLIEN